MSALEILEKEQDILMEQLVSESLEEQVKRHKSKLKVLLRKGAAQQSMGNLKGALTDFQAALAMDPQNTEILTSLVGLQSIIDKSVQV